MVRGLKNPKGWRNPAGSSPGILISRLWRDMVLLVPVLLLLPSCFSSTAIMGTPISEIPAAKVEQPKRPVVTAKDREELAQMAKVSRNEAFALVNGISEYRLGPGDIIEINTRVGDKTTLTAVTVDGRGRISYSFIDDLDVNGLAPSELDDILTRRLSEYVKNPRIDILVKEYKSKYATLMGEFTALRAVYGTQAQTGRVNLRGRTTLMDLVSLGGGYTVDADVKNVQIIRGGRTYRINLYDILERADETQDIIINDRDIVNIPELPKFGERVYVMGEVNSQGIYPLKDAEDLLSAIALAGSFTKLAKEQNTLIVRKYQPGEKPLVMMADLEALLRRADISQNIPLQHGDLVYVPGMVIADVNDWIANMTPLLSFIFYPDDFESRYFMRNYLHIDRYHGKQR